MKLVLVALTALTLSLVSARSNGDLGSCDVFAEWGCKRFANRNSPDRNFPGPCCARKGGASDGPENIPENKCDERCCDIPVKPMFWTTAPRFANDLYAVRSANGDAAKDPTEYYPGELQNIFVKVLKREAKYRGLLINAVAVDHNNKTVGSWEFPAGESELLFWSSPNCPQSAIQNSAEEKPFTAQLRFRAPKNVDGKPIGTLHFQTLIKKGGANQGDFYWSHLALKEGKRTVAATDVTWTKSNNNQDCAAACKAKNLECWPEPMQNLDAPADFTEVTKHVACGLPYLASCAPSIDEGLRCQYSEASCAKKAGCLSKLPSSGILCSCGTAAGYASAHPGGMGINKGGASITAPTPAGPPTPPTAKTAPTSTNRNDDIDSDSLNGASQRGINGLMLVLLAGFASSGLSVSGRRSSGLMLLVPLLGALLLASTPAEAHNWAHSEFRARRKAQSKRPCPPRVGERFNVQVGPGQEFTVAWATGHGHNATVLLVKGEDIHLVGRKAVDVAKSYFAEAPGTAHQKEEKWRRTHGSKHETPRTKESAKYMTKLATTDPLWHVSKIVSDTEPGINIFKIADSRTNNDIRVSYQNPNMPHIMMGGFFVLSEVNFGEFDQIRLVFPTWATAGHYVLMWDWQGYNDCVDIELRTNEVEFPYGKGSGSSVYERVEHCQLGKPYTRIPGTCHRAADSVEECFKDVEDENREGRGSYDTKRIGINVIPMFASDNINPLFTRPDGASVDVPWDSDLCMAGGPLDLQGTVTRSDANWMTQWNSRRTELANTGCRNVIFQGETDLRTAIARCAEKSCKGVEMRSDGKYSGCGSSTSKTGSKFYQKKEEYRKSDYDAVKSSSWEHLVTVSFQPANASVNLPSKTVAETGAMFGTKNGFSYGWTGCVHKHFLSLKDYDSTKYPTNTVENTMAWWPSAMCGDASCQAGAVRGYPYKPPANCKRNTWEIQVPNGWYRVVSKVGPFSEVTGGRPRPNKSNWNQKKWSHLSCAVEGVAFANTESGVDDAYIQYVEVVDGKITYEDAAGWYDCCYIETCDGINAMEIHKQSNPSAATKPTPTWLPQSSNPYEERKFSGNRRIGVVSMKGPEEECAHSWLLKGGSAHCMPEQRTSGWFESTVVGVSNTSCASGGCMSGAKICGYVDKSRLLTQHVTGFGHGEAKDTGMQNRYRVDCGGVVGKYVFVMAKGSGRILQVSELMINQASAVDSLNPNEFKNKFICYPVQARTASEHTPEYITTTDPEDPVFYSTCFMREREVVYLPKESGGASKVVANYEFNGQCVPCDLFTKNRSPKFAVPLKWAFSDKCKPCDTS